MEIKYLLYDTIDNINTKEFVVNRFYYNENTLVSEFKLELLKKFYHQASMNVLNFKIITTRNTFYIDYETIECPLLQFFNNLDVSGIIIILPCLPVGVTIERFDCCRIVIHSNEEIHKNEPHVHVIRHDGSSTRVRLRDLEVLDKNILPKKTYVEIFKYLKNNQDYLIELYNDIVQHKEIVKVTLDITSDNQINI